MKLKKSTRSFLLLLGVILVAAVFVVMSLPQEKKVQPTDLSTIINEYKDGKIESILVEGNKLTATLKDPNADLQSAFKDSPSANLVKDYGFDPQKVKIKTTDPDPNSNIWVTVLLTLAPFLLVIGLLLFLTRQAQGQGNQAMNFGKSRARLYGTDKKKVTFNEVAGADEAKQELTEIVEFLKYPAKFEALGAKIPKGVLLFGPPGTGKTLLARAVAGEAGVPFFSIAGSDFVEMFVGVGASRVRDLFAKAKKNAPCIIFIDEIDAVGRQRGTGMGGGHDEREQTLNQILVEMDGFEQGTNVIVMAATNRPDVLDPALLRPGRFDRRVTLDAPDLKSREAILKVHAAGKPLADNANLEEIAKKTPGFSGADLENLMNEGAILAARLDQKKINHRDLTASLEKVMMGPERKTRLMNVVEKKITAYHEAGHAIVAHILPDAHPVNKISIISRGSAGGWTWQLPDEERNLISVAAFKDDMGVMLGGRMAESIVFDEITTGASNDLQKATSTARRMIMDYGMSKRLPNRVFSSHQEVFLGRDFNETRMYSEDVAKIIDEEVEELIAEAAKRAGDVIRQHRASLDKIANKLIKDEVIDKDEFIELVGPAPHKPKPNDPRSQNNEPRDVAPDASGSPAAS